MGEGIVANIQRSRGRGQKLFIYAPQLYSPDHAPALVKRLVVKSVVCHVKYMYAQSCICHSMAMLDCDKIVQRFCS